MSSSSPRNANPHSRKAGSPQPGRKRTQEVETPDGGEGSLDDGTALDPSEAVTPPHGLATPTATTALEAAEESVLAAAQPTVAPSLDSVNDDDDIEAQAESALQQPDQDPDQEEPAAPAEAMESFVAPPDPSPLGREILGAAEDMAGDWSPAPMPMPGASPSTPLEMLDETDMVEDGPTLHTGSLANAAPLVPSAPANVSMPDEEFLRRVVLPPLPQQHGSGAIPRTFSLAEDSGDKTVISDPPTPEMIASLMPARATAAIRQRLLMPVELTAIELFGLLTGSAVIGGIIGALFLSVPQASVNRPAQAAAAVAAPAPAVKASPPPAIEEALPVPRPTIEPLPSPAERVAPEDSTFTARPATTSKRAKRAAAKKPPKKEWVDPFEQ